MSDTIQSAVVAVTSMADEFPESLPSFEDSNDILDEEPVVPEAFRVKDEDSANWVIRHINEARARATRAKAWAAKEQERAKREEEWFIGRFSGELAAWAQTALPKRKKSVDLPSGTIGFRHAPAKLEVVDEKVALAWAKQNAPAAVVVVPATERLSKSDLALVLKNTGEIPPGCDVTDEGDVFYVK